VIDFSIFLLAVDSVKAERAAEPLRGNTVGNGLGTANISSEFTLIRGLRQSWPLRWEPVRRGGSGLSPSGIPPCSGCVIVLTAFSCLFASWQAHTANPSTASAPTIRWDIVPASPNYRRSTSITNPIAPAKPTETNHANSNGSPDCHHIEPTASVLEHIGQFRRDGPCMADARQIAIRK